MHIELWLLFNKLKKPCYLAAQVIRTGNDCVIGVFAESMCFIRVFEWSIIYKFIGFNYYNFSNTQGSMSLDKQ